MSGKFIIMCYYYVLPLEYTGMLLVIKSVPLEYTAIIKLFVIRPERDFGKHR